MLNFLKRKKNDLPVESDVPEKKGFFSRLVEGLTKTRKHFTSGIANILLGKKKLDQDVLEKLETYLLTADVGVEATEQLIQVLTQQMSRHALSDVEVALDLLKEEMKAILRPVNVPLTIPDSTHPFVILMVGINGSGKTTTIGKLANYFKIQNKSVMLAAGDTFRAAAIEQLQIWGERNEVLVVAQQSGADTAAVIYDAMESAIARKIKVLIADTAGRLHTQTHLMQELKKVNRVLAKQDPKAPHETLLVLDASIGQNALNQAMQFHDAIGVTGLVITKLDGTAKGGIVFAIAKKMNIPIRFIGVGEKMDDLKPFDADAFVSALFESE